MGIRAYRKHHHAGKHGDTRRQRLLEGLRRNVKVEMAMETVYESLTVKHQCLN